MLKEKQTMIPNRKKSVLGEKIKLVETIPNNEISLLRSGRSRVREKVVDEKSWMERIDVSESTLIFV